jgi:copper oxidase (laccase) domain-containing protein
MFLASPLLAREGVAHGFSTREGGVSAGPFASLNLGGSVGDDPAAVAENVRRLAAAAGVPGFATVHQVHGDRVVAGTDDLPPSCEADAVLSVPGGRAPAVKTADCVPVLLFDRRTGRAAAVHAGWRGTRLRIVARAVEALIGGAPGGSGPGGPTKNRTSEPPAAASFAARAADVVAAIGPCIRRCCYEVSPELAAEFAAAFGAEVVDGRHLDLVLANRRVLREAGVRDTLLDVVGGCTSCHPELFFSHRRDRGRTGRHLSWIRPRDEGSAIQHPEGPAWPRLP